MLLLVLSLFLAAGRMVVETSRATSKGVEEGRGDDVDDGRHAFGCVVSAVAAAAVLALAMFVFVQGSTVFVATVFVATVLFAAAFFAAAVVNPDLPIPDAALSSSSSSLPSRKLVLGLVTCSTRFAPGPIRSPKGSPMRSRSTSRRSSNSHTSSPSSIVELSPSSSSSPASSSPGTAPLTSFSCLPTSSYLFGLTGDRSRTVPSMSDNFKPRSLPLPFPSFVGRGGNDGGVFSSVALVAGNATGGI